MSRDLLTRFSISRGYRKPLALALLALSVCSAYSQSPEELKASADKWMSMPAFKIGFDSTRWRSTFEVDRASGMTDFVGGRGYCFNQKVPTKVSFDGEKLIVAFAFRKGCDAIEYRFNPVTRAGEVFSAPAGTEQLVKATTATVTLKE